MPIVESIYRNPNRWRAVINTRDVRHGTAGCLLSLVLFAPLFVRQFGMATIASVVLTYSLVVVPAITNYFSPLKIIMKISRKMAEIFKKMRSHFDFISLQSTMNDLFGFTWNCVEGAGSSVVVLFHLITLPFVCFVCCFIPCIHGCYLALEGFRVTSNQIVFFFLCEKLISPEARMASLYFLLFYTVLAYLHKSLVTRQWSHTFYETNMRDFLKLTTWFIAVRLGKGVAMSFVLIIFTMHFNHVDPNLLFIGVTFTYFVITQKKWTGNEGIISFFKRFQLDVFEEEEDFWIPIYVKTIPIIASVVPMLLLAGRHDLFCLIAVYTNCIAPLLSLKQEFEERYFTHSISLLSFRKASEEDLLKNPTCPVCLEGMRIARVTPCNHVYHAVCLRKCIAVSCLCPMCKRAIS